MPRPRKPSKLKPLRTLRIYCEGEKTEPFYLNGYIGILGNNFRKSVIEVQKTRKNTAYQLVEEAIKAKRSIDSLPDDEYWVVYDRESTVKYTDELHARAYDKAHGAGVKIALCNVCFEHWILLHFVDSEAPYQNYDQLRRDSALNAEIRKVCGVDYEKSSRSLFETLKDKIPLARQRGTRLNRRGKRCANPAKDRPYQINPYVGIVELLDAIDEFV